MTDTRLILSGAKGVKGGPQRERERNSAGGVLLCFVLCSCHSYIVYSSAPFSLCLLIFYYITPLAYIERKNVSRVHL